MKVEIILYSLIFYLGNIHRIAIFASGTGTNAENIIKYFSGNDDISIGMVISNKPDAEVLTRVADLDIMTTVLTKDDFKSPRFVLDTLEQNKINFLVLAGFLLLMPKMIVTEYLNKIVNIHPALLPKYGGKGMYGMNVHRAVHEAQETETGITIHYVNSKFDEGEIIFQDRCSVDGKDTPESIYEKVHNLEMQHYPKIIEKVLMGK